MKKLLLLLLALSLLAGCAAPSAQPETPDATVAPSAQEEQPLSPVYTDWSKLTPYETAEPLYTYHPGHGETLTARKDYGPLLSYVGTMSNVDRYIVDKLPLHGLVTTEGEIVTDPVYADIYWCGPFLLLYEGIRYDTPVESSPGIISHRGFDLTIMAADGSWILEPAPRDNMRLFGSDQLLFTTGDGSVHLLSSDGTLALEFPRSAFEPYLGKDFQWDWEMGPTLTEDNGIIVVWWYNEDNANDTHHYAAYLDMDSGTVSGQPPEGWEPYDYSVYVPDDIPEPPDLPSYNYLTPVEDEVTGEFYYFGYDRDAGSYNLLRQSGEVAVSDWDMQELYMFQPIVRAGLVSTLENNCFCYTDLKTGKTVFRYPVHSNSD